MAARPISNFGVNGILWGCLRALTLTPAIPKLTAAELRVAACITAGMSVKKIATLFGRSYKTIEAHCSNIHEKLGVTTNVQVAVWYMLHYCWDRLSHDTTKPEL